MTAEHTPPVIDELAMRKAVIATALAMNAAGINRGKSGNVSARWRDGSFDGFLVTPTGVPYQQTAPNQIVAMTLRGETRGTLAAVVGVALPSRHLCGARRRAGNRPHACAVRDDARLHASWHPAVSLHDRGGRGTGHTMRRLRDLRHAGAFGPGGRGTRGTPRVPARESRDDRDRRVARAGAGAGGGSRDAVRKCTGVRCRSENPCCCPRGRWTWSWRNSGPTGNRRTV